MQPAHTHTAKKARIAPLRRGRAAKAPAAAGLSLRAMPTVPAPLSRPWSRPLPAVRACPSARRPAKARPRPVPANRNPCACRREDACLRGMP